LKISTKGRYGLRAMVDIAINNSGKPVSIKSIAERQNISEAYLEQVFSSLRKAGLLKAVRGAYGGFEINRPADKITAGEILRSLEGPLETVQCTGCQKAEAKEEAPSGSGRIIKNCGTYSFWKNLNTLINDYMDSITLQNLADDYNTDYNKSGLTAKKNNKITI